MAPMEKGRGGLTTRRRSPALALALLLALGACCTLGATAQGDEGLLDAEHAGIAPLSTGAGSAGSRWGRPRLPRAALRARAKRNAWVGDP